jgi:hypothetical protein
MNPELDAFLNDAFQAVQPTSPEIGRVVVTPDFEATADQQDKQQLSDELTRLLGEQRPDHTALATADGFGVPVSNNCPLLAKYVRSITLHRDPPAEGPWVEVAPPGNWI